MRAKQNFPSYEEAQKIVQEKGFKTNKDYKEHYKELGLPANPSSYYKDKGWIDWYVFLGKKSFPSYEEAQKIVQEKGFKTYKDYQEHYNELGLPSNPNCYYKDNGWIDWYVFLGKNGVSYPSYEEAQKIVQENHIKNMKDYYVHHKKLGLPSSPNNYYKDKGWIDWFIFLDKSKVPTSIKRATKIMKCLSLNPILLKDDAPLQVVYILASQLDKKLANEIESLLNTNAYEDRISRVKEQLKDLKEDTPSKKTASVTTADELSSMESIMAVFEDSMESLPEEVSSDINAILDNYYHNAINRELIDEYDG